MTPFFSESLKYIELQRFGPGLDKRKETILRVLFTYYN